jgi:hypothetical protein
MTRCPDVGGRGDVVGEGREKFAASDQWSAVVDVDLEVRRALDCEVAEIPYLARQPSVFDDW